MAADQATRERARAAALAGIGLGSVAPTPPLRQLLSAERLRWSPLWIICTLGVIDTFSGYGFAVLAPDMGRALGFGLGTVALLIALKTVAIGVAPLPVSAFTGRFGHRAPACGIVAVAWSMTAMATGIVTALSALVAVQLLDGLTTGSVSALHPPLLADSYPLAARMRTQSGYVAAVAFGTVLAPLLVAALVGPGQLTWRGVFVALGALSLLASLSAAWLRDPGYGRFDTGRIRAAIGESLGVSARPAVRLSLGETIRRLLTVPTARRLLRSQAMFGVVLIPFQTFLFYFLDYRWNLDAAARGLFFAGQSAVSVVALLIFGRRIERAYRADPAVALRRASAFLIAGAVLFAGGALAPLFWLMAPLMAAGVASVTLTVPAVNAVAFAVVPAEMRPHMSGLIAIFQGAVGGTAGALVLSGLDTRIGLGPAIASLALPAIAAAWMLRRTGHGVRRDIEAMVDQVVEDTQIAAMRARSRPPPLLACRGVEFSYGPVQVLHGVDLNVADGEIVALLGTNGAGKSTLLCVVAGIGVASRGSVRLRGEDITYLDAERRARLGLAQVCGGRAVFGQLTVEENLQLFASPLGRERRRAASAIAEGLEIFPDLATRLHQRASTLSGGQRQMLGLTRALILRPRLLLIDELSLGLAPIVVGQLMNVLRAINGAGTAIVLVEQSVNVALSIARHAYFMERGRIAFDGPADELRHRDDLLRAVFLRGAVTQTERQT